MILNLGDIVFNGHDHWLVYDRVNYPEDVVQYKLYVLEGGTWETYTAPFAGDMPSSIFTIVA